MDGPAACCRYSSATNQLRRKHERGRDYPHAVKAKAPSTLDDLDFRKHSITESNLFNTSHAISKHAVPSIEHNRPTRHAVVMVASCSSDPANRLPSAPLSMTQQRTSDVEQCSTPKPGGLLLLSPSTVSGATRSLHSRSFRSCSYAAWPRSAVHRFKPSSSPSASPRWLLHRLQASQKLGGEQTPARSIPRTRQQVGNLGDATSRALPGRRKLLVSLSDSRDAFTVQLRRSFDQSAAA